MSNNQCVFIDNSDYFQINVNNNNQLVPGDIFTIGIPVLPVDIRLLDITLTGDVLAPLQLKMNIIYKNNTSTNFLPDIVTSVLPITTVSYNQPIIYDIFNNDSGYLKFTINTISGDIRNLSITVRYIRIL